MASPSWEDVEQHPKYQTFDEPTKLKVRGDFFDANIATHEKYKSFDEPKRKKVRNDWMDSLPKPETKTNVLGAVADVGVGVLRSVVDTPGVIAGAIDDPYTKGGRLEPLIDWTSERQKEYGRADAPGAEEIAIPFTNITRQELRQGTASIPHTAITMGAGAVPAIGGAIATGLSASPAAPMTAPVAAGLFGASVLASGATAYKLDKNAFVREYRDHLERQEGREISDAEFKDYRSDEVADLLHEHGLAEAGWKGWELLLSWEFWVELKAGNWPVKHSRDYCLLVPLNLPLKLPHNILRET